MEHPLIGSLETLTEEELSKKIGELSTKLSIAARSGNGHLCNQIRMALESYQNTYQARLQETYRKQIQDTDFGNKIDIQ
jgi:argininosuccinate lyase